MRPADAIKFFGLNNLSIESDIRRIEIEHGVELGHSKTEKGADEHYYPQFSHKLRAEAEAMATHYSIFYCLENSIRSLIDERLTEASGVDWWNAKDVVPPSVVKNCSDNHRRELETGVTPRSEKMIDYSTFGELGEILRQNWDFFGGTFRDKGAVGRILHSLNTLRGPIAHCKALAEDEVLRLHLALRDWFRQMS
jgi:Swt1-like HEPN